MPKKIKNKPKKNKIGGKMEPDGTRRDLNDDLNAEDPPKRPSTRGNPSDLISPLSNPDKGYKRDAKGEDEQAKTRSTNPDDDPQESETATDSTMAVDNRTPEKSSTEGGGTLASDLATPGTEGTMPSDTGKPDLSQVPSPQDPTHMEDPGNSDHDGNMTDMGDTTGDHVEGASVGGRPSYRDALLGVPATQLPDSSVDTDNSLFMSGDLASLEPSADTKDLTSSTDGIIAALRDLAPSLAETCEDHLREVEDTTLDNPEPTIGGASQPSGQNAHNSGTGGQNRRIGVPKGTFKNILEATGERIKRLAAESGMSPRRWLSDHGPRITITQRSGRKISDPEEIVDFLTTRSPTTPKPEEEELRTPLKLNTRAEALKAEPTGATIPAQLLERF